jgi:PAS domain S-box-containing protein
LVLYTLSGVPREHFARFPTRARRRCSGPTFRGEGVVRSADITAEPHYGQMAPHYGMPAGHLPVRSYLAVPVRSRGGAVLGGLFFGHERAGRLHRPRGAARRRRRGWDCRGDGQRAPLRRRAPGADGRGGGERAVAAQARELELANQQLQDTAAELELQAEELQATAAELEVRTEEAEHAASALGASEARLRDVLEQAPIAVAVLTGPEHVYTMMSPRYAEYVGRHPVLGRPLREAVPELEAEGVAELIGRVYRTGEPFFARERLVRTDRNGDGTTEEYYFDIGYQPLRDAGGEVYAVASVSLDVTAQVRARRAVEAAREAAERARAEAEAANQAKSEFLSTMSHELRTPLNAIAGYAELLAMGVRGPVTDAQRQDLERLRRANQHMIGLISDVLNFARLEAGQVEYTIEDVPLGPLIADLEALVGPQLAAKAVALDHDGCAPDTPDRPHSVRADAEKVRQVLLNLLTNAVKFTGPGGQVALACENDVATGVVRVHVADTGRGIPADQLTRIFEPFVQVERHRTHESQQGVGLGLSISRDLARRMGGDLTVASTPGVGSTFTLTLPAAPRRAALAAERAVRAGA